MKRFSAILNYAIVCAVGACIALPAAAAAARHADRVPGLPEHALAALPRSVTSALLVENATLLRSTDGGAHLWSMLSTSGLVAGIEASWPALAGDLGLAPDRAFDELLGRRVMVAVGDAGHTPGARWVLVTHVTADVERMLRERLRPAARSLVKGLPVLAVGHGEFELATSISGGDHTAERRATVILSPADNPLFDEVLESLGNASASTDAPAELASLVSDLRVDAMLLHRDPATHRETLLGATVERRAIDLRCVSVGTPDSLPAPLPPAVVATLDAQAPAAALAVGIGPTADKLDHAGVLTDILSAMVPLRADQQKSFTNGFALCVVPGRSVMWSHSMAAPSDPAAAADDAARSLTSAWNIQGASFSGEAPSALRVFQGPLSAQQPIAAMAGADAELTWTFDRAPGGDPWWLAAYGERVLARPHRTADILVKFTAHPARMSVLFKGTGPAESLVRAIASGVDAVTFQVTPIVGKPGVCIGRGRVEFAQ